MNLSIKFVALSLAILSWGWAAPCVQANGRESAAAMSAADEVTTIKGVVTDSSGEPIIGASVFIQGTSQGTITDLDGAFVIKAAIGQTLSISYVGFKTVDIALTSSADLKVVLEQDDLVLGEVVVTALGIKRETKALSYNVQKVDGDLLTANKDANFITSLNGKVAGVVINSSAAGAGAAARIVMRGNKSLTKDDNALYVIDGIPMFNTSTGVESGGTMQDQPGSNGAADINPEDIESMSVLTGPSAAALYGSQAASGVILITTKKGAEGKAKVTYSNSTTFSTPAMMPKFQNIYGNDPGNATSWGKELATPSTFKPKNFFQTGSTEINSVTLSVGNEKNQTFASIAATNSDGIIPESEYNRYNFSIRNTTKFCGDKLTLDLGAQYIIQDNKNMVGSGQYFNPLPSLYLFPRGENFDEVRMFERYDEGRGISTQYWPSTIFSTDLDMQNPYWMQKRMIRKYDKKRYMFNASLKYDITPYLYVTGRVRVDNTDTDFKKKYYASTSQLFTGSDKGSYMHQKTTDQSVYADVMASFNKAFIDEKLNVNVQVGASLNNVRDDWNSFSGGLDKIPNFFHYGNIRLANSKRNEGAYHDQTQSVFASAELGWDHQLYLTATARNDWASQLAYASKSSYFYPSVGLSWLISSTFKLPQWFSYAKIRGSFAEVASAPDRYMTLMQYSYNEQTGEYEWPSNHYNTDLKPENTKSWEIGLNTKFFNSKLYLDLTYYRANTYHQTFYVAASAGSGYKNNIVQTGNILNQGMEAAIGYGDSWGDWKFDTGMTFTLNRNKIISLANGVINPDTGEPIVMDYLSKGTLGISGGPEMRLTEGGTIGDLYTNLRLRQSPNGYIWKDPVTGRPAMETLDEYKKIGSTLPKFNAGWTGTVGWKQLSLSWAVTARFGGKVVSDTEAILDRYGVSKRSAQARLNGGVPIEGNGTVDAQAYYETISQAPGSYYMYNATNIRLADLTLSYVIPRKVLGNVADLTVSFTGKNLWMIYCKAPFDPESTAAASNSFYQGIDYFQTPSLRSLGFNVKVTF